MNTPQSQAAAPNAAAAGGDFYRKTPNAKAAAGGGRFDLDVPASCAGRGGRIGRTKDSVARGP